MSELGEGAFAAVEEEEEQPEEQKEVRVKVRYSVFFDGTLNNRTNTEARQQDSSAFKEHGEKSDSYQNDLSNVAKMELYVDDASGFDVSLHTYVEGIGTTDEGGDSTVGYALGMGTTGVKAKVNIGLAKINALISEVVSDDAIIEELVFDIFGFSRGAAAARYFIYQLLSDTPNRRGKVTIPARPIYLRLQNAGYQIEPKNLKVRFVGLYDTVASEGISHSNDTYSLKLDAIGRPEVEKVIHLVSADEHRTNFSLTNINSVGGRGKQIFLPGAHSDIGGGYRDNTDESLKLNESFSASELETDRRRLIEWGYYRDSEIQVETPPVAYSPQAGAYPSLSSLMAKRSGIKHHYGRIPLQIMAEFAKQAGMNISSNLERKERVSSDLSGIYSDLKSYALGGGTLSPEKWLSNHPYPWLAGLRHDYLHFSAHLTPSAVVLTPHKPNLVKNQRKRIVHNG